MSEEEKIAFLVGLFVLAMDEEIYLAQINQ